MGCLKRSKLWTEWDLQVLRVQKERSGKNLCFSLHYGTEEPLVLCFLLTHRWHRHYRFVKCKELFNWLGNSWIPAESGATIFVPSYSALTSFLLSLCPRDHTRKDLTPEAELLPVSFTLHPHVCLDGSACARARAATWENWTVIQCGRRQVEMAISGLWLTKASRALGQANIAALLTWEQAIRREVLQGSSTEEGGNYRQH